MSLGRGRTVERAKRGKSSSSAPFWQRLLFPERNTQTPVPPLLSQPEYSEACDEYLYALVGLICVCLLSVSLAVPGSLLGC